MNIQIFYIVVDLRDTHTLIKLNQSFEWKLHSKYTEIFKKIKNGDLILFSKKSHYSWNIILEVKEKKILEIVKNETNQFRERNKNLLIKFKDKNFLSKYSNSFDVPNLSKLNSGIYIHKDVIVNEKFKESKRGIPEKIFSIIRHAKRDKKKVRDLKLEYLDKCQICNYCLILENGKRHSEVHHLRPIGNELGNDDFDNMIVLCPNHHKAFDFSVLRLDLNGYNVIDLDEKEITKIKFKKKHKLSKENLLYQYYRRHI